MTENDDKQKKGEQHLTEALANFAESEPETEERDRARDKRANAEQEIVDARGPDNKHPK